ncbi:MAG: carbon storage regulator CsrA [Planctomycetes bacterium]|nr:carbon storage regulator CsrA [Planctomycetota bacterium]
MLVLSRKPGEGIHIGDDVEVRVLGVRGHEVRLGFSAPSSVSIHRQEIYARLDRETGGEPKTPHPGASRAG